MSESRRPAVENAPPPPAVMKAMNGVMRAALASPAHGLLGHGLMLLHVTGRKTGRVYDVPVGHHEIDGHLVASAAGGWRRNLAGGADLEVTIDGTRHPAHGELVEDPREVAEIFSALLDQVGLKHAGRVGLRVNVDRAPTLDELEAALVDRRALRIELTDAR